MNLKKIIIIISNNNQYDSNIMYCIQSKWKISCATKNTATLCPPVIQSLKVKTWHIRALWSSLFLLSTAGHMWGHGMIPALLSYSLCELPFSNKSPTSNNPLLYNTNNLLNLIFKQLKLIKNKTVKRSFDLYCILHFNGELSMYKVHIWNIIEK